MEKKTFKTLYGFDFKNKIKEWNIYVENQITHSLLTFSYGYINGKKTVCQLTIKNGKNIGKRNSTTHYQQAILDAQSKWDKKKNSGYTTNLNDLQPQSPQLPMLAHDYKKYSHKLIFPCYIQPKLDGYRMLFDTNSLSVTTRSGKEYTVFKQSKLYQNLCNTLRDFNICLDGELYVHDPSFNFEKYSVLRKQKNLTPADLHCLDQIQYHVYDIVDTNTPLHERLNILKNLPTINNLLIVPFHQCSSKNQIEEYHQSFLSNYYEGSILRNINSKYILKYRSFDLLKYKNFDDSEFPIIDFTSEKDTSGNNENIIIWVCKTSDGKLFKVPSKGSKEERKKLYKEASSFIGKQLWVQYFGLTTDGIPRFPKTMRNGKESIRNEILW